MELTDFARRLATAFAEDRTSDPHRLAVDIISNHTEGELIRIGTGPVMDDPFVRALGAALATHLRRTKFPLPH